MELIKSSWKEKVTDLRMHMNIVKDPIKIQKKEAKKT